MGNFAEIIRYPDKKPAVRIEETFDLEQTGMRIDEFIPQSSPLLRQQFPKRQARHLISSCVWGFQTKLSVSPIGLVVGTIGHLVLFLNNANAMGTAYSAKFRCWRERVKVNVDFRRYRISGRVVVHF